MKVAKRALATIVASPLSQSTITTALLQAFGLVSGVILARALGAEGRGEWAIILLWPTLLSYLGDLGIPTAVSYYASQNEDQSEHLVRSIGPLVLVQSAVLITLSSAIFALLADDDIQMVGTLFAALFIPINLTGRYLSSICQGLELFNVLNRIRLSVQIFTVGFMSILFITGHLDVVHVALVVVAANGLSVVIAILDLGDRAKGLVNPKKPDIGKLLNYGLKSHLGSLAPIETLRVDLAFVAVIAGPVETGLYAVCISAANIIRALGTTVSLLAFPKVSRSLTMVAKIATSRKMLQASFGIAFLLALVLAVTSHWMIPLIYGEDFTEASSATSILAIAMIPAVQKHVLSACQRGANAPLSGSIAEVFGWMPFLLLASFSFSRWGLEGIAGTVALSYLAALVINKQLGGRSLPLTWSDIVGLPIEGGLVSWLKKPPKAGLRRNGDD